MTSFAIVSAAEALVKVRNGRLKLNPAEQIWAPTNEADAYALQAAVMKQLGEVGGWKVGAPSPGGHVSFAPLPKSGLVKSGTTLSDGVHRMRGIEVELAFVLGADLPPRDIPYSRDEVRQAVATVVPLIEVVETRLSDREAGGGLWALGDFLSHGELVLGTETAQWAVDDLDNVEVSIAYNGNTMLDRPCRNAGGNPLDMVARLTGICGEHCGGLKAGQVITTGSLMGLELAPFQSRVSATISGFGEINVTFG